LELRSVNSIDTKDISLLDMLYKSLIDNGFKLERKYFEYSMEKGGYIILLDGFDEVNRERADKVTNEIKSVCNKYKDNKYIVSSRPTGSFIGWNDFAEMTTLELTKAQALSLISKIEFDDGIKRNFIRELDERLYDKYISFASNPLLLTIMLLTFDTHASIPDKLNDFYEQAFSTLFNMHDATKDAYVRDIRTGLGAEDFKFVFSHFCFKSFFRGEYEFTEAKLHQYIQKAKEKTNRNKFRVEDFQDDLIYSVCMLVREGLNYRFSHRSFQEYFAAWYTCKLTDYEQEQLLNGVLKESCPFDMDSYFTMLFNMQGEKTNRIIFNPGLKQLRTEYQNNGFSIKLLDSLFRGIFAYEFLDADNMSVEVLSFSLSNPCNLYNTLRLTCRLNDYSYETRGERERAFAREILDYKNSHHVEIPFDEAVDVFGEERILQCYEWMHKRILFSLSILDKYSETSIGRKRKVASILDEL